MKYTAVILILLSAILLACSSQKRADAPMRVACGRVVACEPVSFTKPLSGGCVGTPSARPYYLDGECLCENEEYVKIPNGVGHTCLHILRILIEIDVMSEAIHGSETSIYVDPRLFWTKKGREILSYDLKLQRLRSDILKGIPNERIAERVTELRRSLPKGGESTIHPVCVTPIPPTSRESAIKAYKRMRRLLH